MSPEQPQVVIGADVAELFPDVEIGVVYLRGLDNRAADARLDELKAAAISHVREQFAGLTPSEHPAIEAWRAAYRVFGTSPKKRRPTLEALVRRVLSDKGLPSVSPVVDAYLVTELQHLVPFGGYDQRGLAGDIVLRRTPGGEPFLGLGDDEVSETKEGEVVYADDARVLTRHWNYRDADATKITRDSTDAILVCEALPWGSTASASASCEHVANQITSLCGGEASITTIRPA